MFKEASKAKKVAKAGAELERQAQYAVGVILAIVSAYFILTGAEDIQQLKPTTVNTAFASGDPWLVLCDKEPGIITNIKCTKS